MAGGAKHATEVRAPGRVHADVSRGHRHLAAEALSRRDPGGVLYGAVVTAGVLAAVSANVSHVDRVALSVGAVVAAYWLAHVYIATQQMLFEGDHRPLHRRTPAAAAEEVFILVGSVPAVVVYLVSYYLAGFPSSSAASLALWFSVGFLFVIGYLGAHRAGLTGWRLAFECLGAASLGLVAVLAKLFLH